MRRFLTLLLVAMMAMPVFGQDTSNVLVPRSLLTPQQISAVTVDNNVSTIGKWVGIGKEVGQAVNGSLEAISKQAVEFAKTDLGHLTVNVLIIKLLGPMLIHVVGGLIVLLIGLPTVIWLIRKNAIVRAIPFETDKDGNTHFTSFEPSRDAKICYTLLFFAVWAMWALTTFSW